MYIVYIHTYFHGYHKCILYIGDIRMYMKDIHMHVYRVYTQLYVHHTSARLFELVLLEIPSRSSLNQPTNVFKSTSHSLNEL